MRFIPWNPKGTNISYSSGGNRETTDSYSTTGRPWNVDCSRNCRSTVNAQISCGLSRDRYLNAVSAPRPVPNSTTLAMSHLRRLERRRDRLTVDLTVGIFQQLRHDHDALRQHEFRQPV